ncbi:MAG: hypothetical protein WB992_05710 [Bryobacteraceae bacterium]
MTSTMEHPPISDAVIAKIREQFAAECKRMLEGVSKHANCTCGRGSTAEEEHGEDCPVAVFREGAHAVWLWGQS